MRSSSRAAALAASIFVAGTAVAPGGASGQVVDAPDDTTTVFSLEPIVVSGRAENLTGVATTASQGFVGHRDLMARPLTREGELLETVPGMILTQHSGGGKANQIFIRGFNLDHGTDFATRIEGVPINLPTHAHGQGYTDLNFLIPELVEHIEYSLGNYYAEIGDFSAAGGAEFRLRQRIERPLFEAEAGAYGHERLLAAASTDMGSGTLLVGGEAHRYDGPWDVPERLRKLSGLVRYTWRSGSQTLSLLGMAYDNSWNATDQIPSRAVVSGLIDRFGNIDPTLGGSSHRYSLSGSWNHDGRLSSQRVEAYAVHYDLDLFSNFTFLLEDPAQGDQFRQEDKGRWTVGANLTHLQSLPIGTRMHQLTVGAQVRNDLAHLTLSRTLERVTTLGVVRSDDVNELGTGLYAQLESPWTSHFRTTLGLRGDLYRFDVTSDRPENTGDASDRILSPKLSLDFGPWSGAEIYLSGGLGFHSNDARGTVTTVDPTTGSAVDPVDPLVRSKGVELGVRASPAPGWQSTLSLWGLDLDSELLFVGDAGTNEPSDPSRRVGVTFANFYDIDERWTADLDVSFTRARFLDVAPDQDRIPGALENVVAAGLAYRSVGDGLLGAVRIREFGPYPLIEDDSERATASALLNVELGYRLGSAELRVELLNVLDEKSSDIQYWYESRLSGEPAGGVSDLHFHPAVPRELRIALSWGK